MPMMMDFIPHFESAHAAVDFPDNANVRLSQSLGIVYQQRRIWRLRRSDISISCRLFSAKVLWGQIQRQVSVDQARIQ